MGINHQPGCNGTRNGLAFACDCAMREQFGRVPMNSYCWSPNEENYEGECPSRAAALKDGLSEMGLEEGDTLFTARIVRRTLAGYLTDRFTGALFEVLQEAAYEEVGEHAEGWLNDVTAEHDRELEDELRGLLNRWARTHSYNPHFFAVTDIELYIVQPEDVPDEEERDQTTAQETPT